MLVVFRSLRGPPRVLDAAAPVSATGWEACAGGGKPFLSHSFFAARGESRGAAPRAGWQPVHLVIDDPEGRPSAIAPAYAKSHSQGEYVFDQNWADAYMRAGGAYYPKLQLAVPFTPVPGPRLLLRDPGQAAALIAAAETLTRDRSEARRVGKECVRPCRSR